MEKEKLSRADIGLFIAAVLIVPIVGFSLQAIPRNMGVLGAPARCHEWSEPDAVGMQHCLLECGTTRFFKFHPGHFFPRPETYFKNKGDESAVGFPCRRDTVEAFNVRPLPTLPPPKN